VTGTCRPDLRLNDDNVTQSRQRETQGRDGLPLRVGASDKQGGVAVAQDVGNAFRVVEGVQWDWYACQRQSRLVDPYCVEAVGQKDGDARAARQTKASKCVGPARDPLTGLSPADACPGVGLGIELSISLGERRRGHSPGKELGQGEDA